MKKTALFVAAMLISAPAMAQVIYGPEIYANEPNARQQPLKADPLLVPEWQLGSGQESGGYAKELVRDGSVTDDIATGSILMPMAPPVLPVEPVEPWGY